MGRRDCPVGKVAYHTRDEAIQAIARVLTSSEAPTMALKAYKCPVCGKFHMSSSLPYRVQGRRELMFSGKNERTELNMSHDLKRP